MASRIVPLARKPETDARPAPAPAGKAAPTHLWSGASSRRYSHTVYSLIECPPLPKAAYILVRRHLDGRREALHIGVGQSDAPTLNLAHIRQRGATLGANEVHVYALTATDSQRQLASCDLRAGLFNALGAEPAQALGA